MAIKKSKGKVLPYSLPSVEPEADRSVQAVSPQVTKPSTRRYAAITFGQACSYLHVIHQMSPAIHGSIHLIQLTTYLSTQKDERLSWPG